MGATLRTALHLTCDNKGCDFGDNLNPTEAEFDNLDVRGAATSNRLRGAAVVAGWKYDGTSQRWICPSCVVAANEAARDAKVGV